MTAPDGGSNVQYWVRRSDGVTTANACGTTEAGPLFQGSGSSSCDDTSVPTGSYTYTVTSVWRSWTGESPASGSVSVQNDTTPPNFGSPALTFSTGGAFTSSSGTTVFYNPQSSHSGSFSVATPNVTDPETGIQKRHDFALSGLILVDFELDRVRQQDRHRIQR